MSRFVIVVDTQYDFMLPDGKLPVPGADSLIAPITSFLAHLSPAQTAGVLFTYDTHEPDIYAGSAESADFPLHCVKGTPGWQNVINPAIVPDPIPRYRLEKGVFAMWAEPDILIEDDRFPDRPAIERDAFFDALQAQGVREVAVLGVAADYCVKWAIDGLVARNFRVHVLESLTKGIHRCIADVVKDEFADTQVALAHS